MKGLILAGGSGTRLRPFTYSQPKHLLPVGGKPIIDYGIEALAAAGIREIGVVVGVETDGPLRQHLADGSRYGVEIDYVFQPKPRGLAHAVMCAEQFLAGEPFFMFLGDNLLQDPLADIVRAFNNTERGSVIALKEVPNPSDYGVAQLDERGAVVRLVEKPTHPPSSLAVVGAYAFVPEIVDACKKVLPSNRGELEITDAIQLLIDDDRPVFPHRLRGWWKDTGKAEHLLQANQCVLDELKGTVEGEAENCELSGAVYIAWRPPGAVCGARTGVRGARRACSGQPPGALRLVGRRFARGGLLYPAQHPHGGGASEPAVRTVPFHRGQVRKGRGKGPRGVRIPPPGR